MDMKADGVTQVQSLLGRKHHSLEKNELKRAKENANFILNMCHQISTDRMDLHLRQEMRGISFMLKLILIKPLSVPLFDIRVCNCVVVVFFFVG